MLTIFTVNLWMWRVRGPALTVGFLQQGPCHTELHAALDTIASSQQKLGEKFTTFYLPNCDKNGFYKAKQVPNSQTEQNCTEQCLVRTMKYSSINTVAHKLLQLYYFMLGFLANISKRVKRMKALSQCMKGDKTIFASTPVPDPAAVG